MQRTVPSRSISAVCLGLILALNRTQNAADNATVEVVADLLERFRPSLASNSSDCTVRRPASAGGVKQDGLFEHPKSGERPARVQYTIALPKADQGDLLLFAFDIAIADGIQFGRGEDGVRFAVEVDGQPMFTRDWSACRWEPHALDFTPWAGREVQLALLVHARGNTTYDWATWGAPRILHFRKARLSSREPGFPDRIATAVTEGAVAIKANPGLKISLRPFGSAPPMEIAMPGAQPGLIPQVWVAQDFKFSDATQLGIEWEPKSAPPEIWIASYPPQLRLVRSGPARGLIFTGDSVPLRVTLKNEGRGKLEPGKASVSLKANTVALPPKTLPGLAPGETWQGEWDWKAPRPGLHSWEVELRGQDSVDRRNGSVEIFGQSEAIQRIQNDSLRIEFVRGPEGFAYARVFARQEADWAQVAVWRPLFQIVSDTTAGERTWEIRPESARLTGEKASTGIELTGTARDADNVEWRVKLNVALDETQPAARVRYEWIMGAPRSIRALWGPNLYVGDSTTGDAKTWGLVPGLEYLYGAERSSNPRDFAPPLDDRRTPHPNKLTVPLMAVTVGPRSHMPPGNADRFFTPDSLKDQPPQPAIDHKSPISNLKSDITVAVLWDPLQRWDGEHAFPSMRFASPNFDEGMENHRLALFLPSSPDFVPENGDRATQPYRLTPEKPCALEANLVVSPGPVTVALREWLRLTGGLPKPSAWPRTFQEELDICRAGFMKTVWDASTEKWRHCIGWAPSHAPGFAALMWLDSQLAEQTESRKQSRDRVELAVKNMLRDGGPASFTSQANCHIMQWEFPFLYGFLPEALASLENQIQHLIRTQRPDGGWVYQPGNEQQASLGRTGDSVLGTCANRAATLLRYARITGDRAALAAGERALTFMEGFRVPRGGQTWECPMYEPDILAAAYAVRAYHDAFRSTGNRRWLHDAVYWAETGVPFVYLWTLPDRPMMLGATIPVFGSTFYTHTWLAVPVQWCGLVYAYHVFHLAQELEHTPLAKTDSALPLALNFSPADWKRIVELITASATHQQFAGGERIGAYPDSISNFEQRNGAFINPEDILVNVLALQGHDPDIQTARIPSPHAEVVVSSAARIENSKATNAGVAFDLKFFTGEMSHTLLVGLKPREILVAGARLAESGTPVRRDPGWWWEEKTQRLYLTVHHGQPVARVEIIR